jgi:radical SAM superfamily enzyme YgiQ (UPF0313 family)
MKAIFITPASSIRRKKFYRIGNKFYGQTNSITGPLVLGHILKDAGHSVEVYEELYTNIDFSKFSDADIICIYTMTSSAPRAYQLADMFRKSGKKVVIGGMHASSMPEEALEHADQVIVGEGESIIKDVVEGKISDKIIYAECIKDLDSIPFPDYSILKTPCESANIMSTRGCPFKCNFCTTSRMFTPYRERSVDNVIEELKLYKKLGFKYVSFEDDNFTANKDRAKRILRKMIENDLIFKDTFFFGRTDLARDEELLKLLKQAHLTSVLVGIESLNQKSLDYINKQQNIEDIEECGKALKKYKIKLIASLVLGLDEDNVDDIRRGVKFCKHIEAFHVQPAILTPFPKTPVYEQMVKEGRMLTENWELFDMMSVTFKPKRMTAWELQNEFFKAIKDSYKFIYSFKIFRNYGFSIGMNWLGFWLITKFGFVYSNITSRINNGNPYNQLRTLSLKHVSCTDKDK